jgi:hypothetical protein
MRHHRCRKSMVHNVCRRMNHRRGKISSKKHVMLSLLIFILFTLTAYEKRDTLVLMKTPIFYNNPASLGLYPYNIV